MSGHIRRTQSFELLSYHLNSFNHLVRQWKFTLKCQWRRKFSQYSTSHMICLKPYLRSFYNFAYFNNFRCSFVQTKTWKMDSKNSLVSSIGNFSALNACMQKVLADAVCLGLQCRTQCACNSNMQKSTNTRHLYELSYCGMQM